MICMQVLWITQANRSQCDVMQAQCYNVKPLAAFISNCFSMSSSCAHYCTLCAVLVTTIHVTCTQIFGSVNIHEYIYIYSDAITNTVYLSLQSTWWMCVSRRPSSLWSLNCKFYSILFMYVYLEKETVVSF